MRNSARAAAVLHNFMLSLLAALTVPAIGALFLANLTPGTARAMEALAPAWSWLMGAWGLSVGYFFLCIVLSTDFREALLAKIAGLRERDEREELVTAKAARSVYLVTLAGFLAAGLAGMIRVNIFSYTRWEGGRVPELAKVGPYELRKGKIEKKGFLMWPSLGLPSRYDAGRHLQERVQDGTQYYSESGSLFEPEVSRTFFALALIQILLLHLFARRVRA